MDGVNSYKRLRDDPLDGVGSTEGSQASKKARGTAPSITNSRYADDRRNLLKLVNDLHASGADELLEIPRVVVIGNQSAGKSSVVEAMSGISIRMQYDERTTKKLDKPITINFGGEITDKGDVELALRRAQFAVLNPEADHHRVFNMSYDELKTGPDPWARSTPKSHFGINNLVRKIGPLLQRVIRDSLPRLQEHTKTLYEETEQSLADLPLAIDKDVVALMLELVSKLSSDMTELVKGSQGNEELIQQCRQSYKEFKATISATAPTFRPCLRGEKPSPSGPRHSCSRASAPIVSSSTPAHVSGPAPSVPTGSGFASTAAGFSFERSSTANYNWSNGPSTSPPIGKNPFGSGSPGTAFGTGTTVGNTTSGSGGFAGFAAARHNSTTTKAAAPAPAPTPTPAPISSSQVSTPSLLQSSGTGVDDLDNSSDEEDMLWPARFAAAKCGMDLDDMHDHIEKSLSRELPVDVPLSAKQALIVKFQSEWEKASLTCLNSVRAHMRGMLYTILQAHFGRWELLHGHIRDVSDGLVQDLCSDAWSFVGAILEAERTPATQNEHYFQTSQDVWLSRYSAKRGSRPKTNLDAEKTQEVLAGLVGLGFHGLNVEDLQRLNAPDEYERELVFMAYVRGYFKVSFKRVIDVIPMLVDLKFLKELSNQLQLHLIKALDVGGEDMRDRFERYFSEDEEVIARRKELTLRKEMLEVARTELYKFTM